MFRDLLKRIRNWSIKTKRFVLFFGIFVSSCSVFVSGITYSNTILEDSATYISEIAKSEITTNHYLSFQIRANKEENEKKYPSTYNEYFYWKYIFRHSDFSFLSTVNGGKTHSCQYREIDVNENISFLYCGNNYNPKYGDYYKHEVYDIQLMFQGKNIISPEAINFFAISQSRASQILQSRGFEKSGENYSVEQFETLLGTNTTLSLDNKEYCFTISNVFFEEGTFFQNVRETFGEFALSYIHFPDNFERECSFIFNKYTYQNLHKIKRIRMLFDDSSFSIAPSLYNFVSKDFSFNNSKINPILQQAVGNQPVSIVLTTFSLLLFLVIIFFLILFYTDLRFYDFIIICCSFLTPYALLAIINIIKPIVLLFSHYSCMLFMLLLIIFVICMLYVMCKKGLTRKI